MTSTAIPEITVARRAMACEFSITLPAETRRPVEAASAALDEIERLEEMLSVFRPESELAQLNRRAAEGPVEVSAELFSILMTTVRLSRGVQGAFDPAAGALVRAPSREALSVSGLSHVSFDVENRRIAFDRPGVEFNLGAFGKGYALDRAAAVLVSRFGIRSALLQGGQSSILAVGAEREWPVQLMDPTNPERRLRLIHLRGRALATSAATYRRGHILDPRTGRPADRVAAVTVLARRAGEADALSTALFVMGEEAGRRLLRDNQDLDAIFVRKAEVC